MWLPSWISLFFTSPHFIPYPLIGGENKVCGIKSSGATNKSVNQNKFLHLITKVQSWKRFQFSHVHATIILTCFSLLVHMTTNCPLAVLLVARGDWFGQPTLMSLLVISYWFFSAYLFYSSVFDIYCITYSTTLYLLFQACPMLWQRAQIFISGSLNAEAKNPRTAGKPDHLVVY